MKCYYQSAPVALPVCLEEDSVQVTAEYGRLGGVGNEARQGLRGGQVTLFWIIGVIMLPLMVALAQAAHSTDADVCLLTQEEKRKDLAGL